MSNALVNSAGELLSHYATLFDLTYLEYVSGKPSECKKKLQELLTEFETLRGSVSEERLLKKSTFALLAWQEEFGFRGAADIVGDLVAGYFRLDMGEARFFAAYAACLLYHCFLSSHGLDTLLPPDFTKTQKLLQKKCGVKYADTLKTVDFSGANGYFRLTYIVGEYREDLRALLESFDMRAKQRYFRRLYDDAGFSLKTRVNAKELLSLVALGGGIAGDTFLGYLKRTGFLESFM